VSAGDPGALDDFIALYAAGRYWDAHEALERIWRRSTAPDMMVLHGLIQWVVAMEHVRRGNPRGARRLLAKSWAKLEPAPADALGLDLGPLRAAQPRVAAAIARWEAGGPAPAGPPPEIARIR
jgi:predicted metal-dependent hydrolase